MTGSCRTQQTTDEQTTDEWVEVGNWHDLPDGARIRNERVKGNLDTFHNFVHRDDLPDNHDEGEK